MPVKKSFFSGKGFSAPPNNILLTPIAYFKIFLKDEFNETLLTQTNLYSMQETANPINTARA